jgi:hypothetical protein|nr:MAG TPA: Protein of unknown function (DUF1642) [Caudoviricetes sp.]
MKHNELLKELEKRMSRYGYCDTWTHIEIFIKEYEALTKDEKPIRLKDVIKRIKGFDDETKLKWTYDILKELGSDFASKIFHEAYQQGRFDEALETHHEPQKPVVPQFVANWIANVKRNGFKFRNSSRFYEEIVSSDDAYRVMYYILKESIAGEAIRIWVNANRDAFARAWLDGYKVEKEPKYKVKVKNTDDYLNETEIGFHFFDNDKNNKTFTRKELEYSDFAWVLDCPGIELVEVIK